MSLWQSIKRWVSGIFPKKDIEQKLQIKIATSTEMQTAQELWRQMDLGKAPWNSDKVPSLMICNALNKEIANLVTVEAAAEVSGSPRAEYLNEQLQSVINNLQSAVQKGCAGGTFIYKPFIRNDEIHVIVVENNMFYPIKYNAIGELVEAVFLETLERDNYFYTLTEQMVYDEIAKTLTYIYRAFQSKQSGNIGIEVSLSSIEEWANLEELSDKPIPDAQFPWFAVFNMPQQNAVEQRAVQGSALCANAVNDIRKADELEELTDHEFKAGRLKQNVSSDMVRKDANGEYIIDSDVFKVLESNENKGYVDTYNPPFRDESLRRRKNDINQSIESNVGISRGTISDIQQQAKTATEVESGRQKTATVVRAIQEKALQPTLTRLVAVMDDMATHFMLAPMGNYDVSFWWKDSVLVTDAEEQAAFVTKLNQMILLKQQGIISAAELRAFYTQNSDSFSKLTTEMIGEAMKALPQTLEE